MASGTTAAGEARIVLSAYEMRIAASLAGWARYRARFLAQYPDHFAATPRTEVSHIANWHVIEHVCTWTDRIATLMPLCDTISIITMSAAEGIPCGTSYLALEVVLPLAIVSIVRAKLAGEVIEFLRLSELTPGQTRALLAHATPDRHVFTPDASDHTQAQAPGTSGG